MNKGLKVLSVCHILLPLVALMYAKTEREGKTIYTIERAYWEGCETGEGACQPLLVERDSEQDSVMLIMPCGGTFTTVELSREQEQSPLRTVEVDNEKCPPQFDLTGLKDGDYKVSMLSCGLGGTVFFSIKTI